MLIPEPNPQYGSAIFVVPKGSGKFRMVVDLRGINQYTLKTTLDLTCLETQMSAIQSATCFAGFDVLSGFDFLEVEPDRRKYFTVVTPFGAYQMAGAPQGWVNSSQLYLLGWFKRF